MDHKFHRKRRLSTFQIIILGFVGVILLGALLLMLPISSKARVVTPFADTLFTATSAVCVTGLVVKDTATYWSSFGQFLILLMIQIGGLGVVTVVASIAMLSGRRISLMQRSTMQEAIAAPKVGGIVRLLGFIVRITLVVELLGALVMLPIFCRDFGIRGVWMALFHSVSAFCNAGFDLMGTLSPFSSLTSYAADPVIILTIVILIIVGGIGFLTWDDMRSNKWHLHKYRMQSKVILVTTAVLLIGPTLYFFFAEFTDSPMLERFLLSLFAAVSPRTAGFNSADLAAMGEGGQYLTILLMLIGGCPGSTAGGMKTTTVAVLFASAIANFRRKEATVMFDREIEDGVVKNAATILVMYLVLFFFAAIAISNLEGLPMNLCLFETGSAMGTAGLTLGITTSLGMASRVILIILMFLGRVGGMTLIFAALASTQKNVSKFPKEKITVG